MGRKERCVEKYRRLYDYNGLRPGNVYVLELRNRSYLRVQCADEGALAEAIDWARRAFPRERMTVVQMPAQN
jgi:hypothetical protein